MNTTMVNGMRCEHCRKNVSKAVSAIDGVSDVSVSLEDKYVTWNGDASLAPKVSKAITDLGFTVA